MKHVCDKEMFTAMLMACPAAMLGGSIIGMVFGYDFIEGMSAGLVAGIIIATVASLKTTKEVN